MFYITLYIQNLRAAYCSCFVLPVFIQFSLNVCNVFIKVGRGGEGEGGREGDKVMRSITFSTRTKL